MCDQILFICACDYERIALLGGIDAAAEKENL